MIQDSTIIAQLKEQPRQAVAMVLSKYGDALLGVIFRIVQSREVAEEVLQDSMIKVWKNAAKYDEHKGKLFTWLLNIARNTAIDKVRLKKFQRQQKSAELDATVSNDVRYSEEMQIKDVGLHQRINQLDEKYRTIIDLIYLQGYTQSEVVKELDIPLGTVKSRVRIAIR
ncbi:MAG: sigma-70 family RNA polymerase sigma factor, partial [Bacteroidota bacterium]